MSRRKHGGDDNGMGIAILLGVLFWALCWIILWVGIIVTIVALFGFVYWFNEEYSYELPDYFPFLSYGLVILFSICLPLLVLINTGKIDATFLNWGKEGSNYVTVGKGKHGSLEPQVNKEGIVENAVISSMPEGNTKQLLEIPGIIVNNSVDTIHNWLIQALKKIFTGN